MEKEKPWDMSVVKDTSLALVHSQYKTEKYSR